MGHLVALLIFAAPLGAANSADPIETPSETALDPRNEPRVVDHQGLLYAESENTLAGYISCDR